MSEVEFSEMEVQKRLAEELLHGAWQRHSVVGSERTAKTLNRAVEIREAIFDE